MISKYKSNTDRVIVTFGVVFLMMEIWKQIMIWKVEFGGRYEIWYFPFQLCSMPMYLCLLYMALKEIKCTKRFRAAILTFIRDYGFLGGIMALIVHDGLIHQGFPLLTAHGFIWHVLMLLLSIYISFKHISLKGNSGFASTLPLFMILSVIAEVINVIFHNFGDCDMFYISPYHNSSQMIFDDIDSVIGRPLGIIVYLISVCAGAFVVHFVLDAFFEARVNNETR
ncbi:TMEM164 family acyltransferase [Oribacterium sp. WCC10]|uniref:TMEM164 family acyltransferase n=1 Tax=Oribacterium sp. WCC10 TaxID=1855343 RepID=UPI0008E705D1|nr:YwaF family protein [Oribacterium sp. WCC10]SFG34916.1 Integral membrane protein (intg_mem_TP0381) [Oribacterium sp. WCC10]